jgi:hypothetical protein
MPTATPRLGRVKVYGRQCEASFKSVGKW